MIKTTVVIPAPTLSAVVIVFVTISGRLSPLRVPALGSPLLVPPVEFDRGGGTLRIKFDWITSSAAICCPRPVPSSNFPVVHFREHWCPSGPPVQAFAAPRAEACSLGNIWGAVKGATWVVAAIQRDK